MNAETRRVERNSEGLLGGDTKGPADAEARASGELGKEFATFRVQTVTRANDKILDEMRRPGYADAGLENPLAPGEGRIAAGAENRLGCAELFVVAGDNKANVANCIRAEIEGIVLRIEIRKKAIFFVKRAVPVPTESGSYGQIGFQSEIILDEETGLLRAKVTVGLAIQELPTAIPAADISCQEVGEVPESESSHLVLAVKHV